MSAQYTASDDPGSQDGSVVVYQWSLSTAVPDGVPVRAAKYADRCFTVVGTVWGGATCQIEFSNDGVNWFPASNAAGGAAATFVGANGGKQIIERALYMRPNLSVPGAGASVVVQGIVALNNPLRT